MGRVRKANNQEANMQCDVQNYNYDNPNDSQYCCEQNASFNGDNDDDGNDNNDCGMNGNDFLNEDNLCDVPEMVSTSFNKLWETFRYFERLNTNCTLSDHDPVGVATIQFLAVYILKDDSSRHIITKKNYP